VNRADWPNIRVLYLERLSDSGKRYEFPLAFVSRRTIIVPAENPVVWLDDYPEGLKHMLPENVSWYDPARRCFKDPCAALNEVDRIRLGRLLFHVTREPGASSRRIRFEHVNGALERFIDDLNRKHTDWFNTLTQPPGTGGGRQVAEWQKTELRIRAAFSGINGVTAEPFTLLSGKHISENFLLQALEDDGRSGEDRWQEESEGSRSRGWREATEGDDDPHVWREADDEGYARGWRETKEDYAHNSHEADESKPRGWREAEENFARDSHEATEGNPRVWRETEEDYAHNSREAAKSNARDSREEDRLYLGYRTREAWAEAIDSGNTESGFSAKNAIDGSETIQKNCYLYEGVPFAVEDRQFLLRPCDWDDENGKAAATLLKLQKAVNALDAAQNERFAYTLRKKLDQPALHAVFVQKAGEWLAGISENV
jgi:hypothetical protein